MVKFNTNKIWAFEVIDARRFDICVLIVQRPDGQFIYIVDFYLKHADKSKAAFASFNINMNGKPVSVNTGDHKINNYLGNLLLKKARSLVKQGNLQITISSKEPEHHNLTSNWGECNEANLLALGVCAVQANKHHNTNAYFVELSFVPLA